MYPIITKLGGRRFIMAMFGMILVSLLLFNNRLKDETVYACLMIAFSGIYAGSNTTQKVTNIKAGIVE